MSSESDKKTNKLSGVFSKLKKVKHAEIIIAIVAVVVMLAIYFSAKINSSTKKVNRSEQTSKNSNYCRQMEANLNEALGSIAGVGKIKLVINWESSVESVIAYITNNGTNSSTSTPQIIQGASGGQPVVLREIYPKALGVIIVCEGGGNVGTKLDIINAVSVLLDITPDKISVYAMKQ